jgi:hypothetical protein
MNELRRLETNLFYSYCDKLRCVMVNQNEVSPCDNISRRIFAFLKQRNLGGSVVMNGYKKFQQNIYQTKD